MPDPRTAVCKRNYSWYTDQFCPFLAAGNCFPPTLLFENVSVLYLIRLLQALKNPASFPWKPVKVKEVDCRKLFAGDSDELKKALTIQNTTSVGLQPTEITQKAKNCKEFIREFGFVTDPLTEEEKSFPIAYSVLLHKEAEQVRVFSGFLWGFF